MATDYKIVKVHGHYVLEIDGEFYCTADTYHEAYEEYKEYERSHISRNEDE